LAVPVALVVYLLLVAITLVQPVSVAGLSLTVPVPGRSTAQLFGLPDRPITVLVVGLDIRPNQGGPSRTDSILLLRIDPAKNRAAILSIPRDTMMQLPLPDGGSRRARVNAALVYNWSRDDPQQAPAALAKTLEDNLGVHVDYYVIFNQRAAASIIDAAGGVTVVVRKAFGQDNYSDDDINVIPQFFEEGEQHLDGYQAVAYGRIRQGSTDLDRILRQQQVAEGLVAQLSSLSNARRLPGVWDAFQDSVTTDLGLRQSAGVFVLLKRIGTDRIVSFSLGEASVSGTRCRGALLLLRPEEAARIISEAFDDETAGQTAAQLLVAAGVTP
jgi:LCP family protein required for cell wall assembly